MQVHINAPKLCTLKIKHKVYQLKPPFIKVEDQSGKYRPLIIQDMKNWPMTIQDYVDYFKEQDKKTINC